MSVCECVSALRTGGGQQLFDACMESPAAESAAGEIHALPPSAPLLHVCKTAVFVHRLFLGVFVQAASATCSADHLHGGGHPARFLSLYVSDFCLAPVLFTAEHKESGSMLVRATSSHMEPDGLQR